MNREVQEQQTMEYAMEQVKEYECKKMIKSIILRFISAACFAFLFYEMWVNMIPTERQIGDTLTGSVITIWIVFGISGLLCVVGGIWKIIQLVQLQNR